MRIKRLEVDRFWEKVDEYGPVHPVLITRCYVWTGYKNEWGYGVFRKTTSRTTLSHRYTYEQHVGPIADGMYVCHHCDNPACVRPAHLFQGTSKDNAQDCSRKGRQVRIRGIDNNMATVPVEITEKILREYAIGNSSQRSLSRKFGIAQITIGQWITGRCRATEIDPKLLAACQAIARRNTRGNK